MANLVFSCKGCLERYPGCHDKCSKYQGEKAEYDRLKAAVKADKMPEAYIVDAIRDKRDQSARRRRYGSGMHSSQL